MDFSLTPKEIKHARLETCKACPLSKKTIAGLTCGMFGVKSKHTCGCLINAKIQFTAQSCPSKKW